MTETWPSLLATLALLVVGAGLGWAVTTLMDKIDHH